MSLEALLRSTDMTYGRISLFVMDGTWRASVDHYPHGRSSAFQFDGHSDPVDALRVALLDDERKGREVQRRYADAPKMGTDFEDLLG